MPDDIPRDWQVLISRPAELDRVLSPREGPFLYRGQSNPAWTLKPGIERDRDPNHAKRVDAALPLREQRIITECQKRLADLEPPLTEDNNVEWLNRIQHYGGKTRLLDVTSDPLIAVWFALDDPSKECQRNTEIAVWRFQTEFVLQTARDCLCCESDGDRFDQLLNRHLKIEMEENPHTSAAGIGQTGLLQTGRGFTTLPEAIVHLPPAQHYHHSRAKAQKASFLAQTGVVRNFFKVMEGQFGAARVPEDIAQFIITLDATMHAEIRQRLADEGINGTALFPEEPVPRSRRCVE